MVVQLSKADKEFLLRICRESLKTFIDSGFRGLSEKILLFKREVEEGVLRGDYSDSLLAPGMAFVTLKNRNKGLSDSLRGCIGFIRPEFPLFETVVRASVEAGFSDPRFNPLSADELPEIVVEVSVLSPFERIVVDSPDDLLRAVVVGRDGLMLKKGFHSGLLLPQVPVEYGWGVEEFLDHLCLKSGLAPGCWKKNGVEIYRFSAEVFSEEESSSET